MSPSRFVTLVAATFLISATLAAKPSKKPGTQASRCSLAHYPVAVGNVSEYKTTSKQLDAEGNVVSEASSTYTEEVAAIDANSYRTKNVSAGNASESKWLCGNDGIALEYDVYPETKITSSGVSIPATMEVGGSWAQSFAMEGPGVNQSTRTTNRVTKREMVSVPAGTFEAWRVDWESTTTLPGNEAPNVIRGVAWYATSVGLVKSSVTVAMEMDDIRSVESVTELVKQRTK
ncbi:MAG: hypothetical protein HYU52_12025 [Acidobacteria bacterium]|nr:hypothetical protein [Acidobacteriota bacterium]